MVVVSIIMVISAMAMTQYRNGIVHSKEAVLQEDLFRLRDAIDQYYADKGQYPASLSALVTDGYVRAVPKDPMTDSASTWQEVPAEPDPGNPMTEPGVYNVRSGSDGTALNGTKYSDW